MTDLEAIKAIRDVLERLPEEQRHGVLHYALESIRGAAAKTEVVGNGNLALEKVRLQQGIRGIGRIPNEFLK